MATHGARRLLAMARNAAHIVGIEALAAAQGCDFHAPLASSPVLETVRTMIRQTVPTLKEDRHFAPDMDIACRWVVSGALAETGRVSMRLE